MILFRFTHRLFLSAQVSESHPVECVTRAKFHPCYLQRGKKGEIEGSRERKEKRGGHT